MLGKRSARYGLVRATILHRLCQFGYLRPVLRVGWRYHQRQQVVEHSFTWAKRRKRLAQDDESFFLPTLMPNVSLLRTAQDRQLHLGPQRHDQQAVFSNLRPFDE